MSFCQFPMGPGPDGPMGAMGAMEPHHMNGSLGGFKHGELGFCLGVSVQERAIICSGWFKSH